MYIESVAGVNKISNYSSELYGQLAMVSCVMWFLQSRFAAILHQPFILTPLKEMSCFLKTYCCALPHPMSNSTERVKNDFGSCIRFPC